MILGERPSPKQPGLVGTLSFQDDLGESTEVSSRRLERRDQLKPRRIVQNTVDNVYKRVRHQLNGDGEGSRHERV